MRVVACVAVLLLVAGACASVAKSDFDAVPTARPSTIPRPGPAQIKGERPVLLRSSPAAGAFTLPYAGGWRYDGPAGTLDPAAAVALPIAHAAPRGTLVAIERQSSTPGGYYVSSELAVRDQATGAERVIYRAPQLFYWSGWSPDGHYLALWEVDFYSGSVDLDGRPLVVLDARTGARVDLGRTLLNATTAWTAPHTLAFVAGGGRMVWDTKALRLWSPESGAHELTAPGVVGFAPVWSADGHSLYFVSGPAGHYDPVAFFTGRGIGDRAITIYDATTGTQRQLAHEAGFVDEGARPSRDGSRLLVLRRQTVDATDPRSIPATPLEVWLTNAEGKQGTPLVRVVKVGFGYYGWYPGPSEWDWSE